MKEINVVAAVIIKDGKVFAAQRGTKSLNGKWEFPGGKIDAGESSKEALKREIQEEMATEIEVLDKIAEVCHTYEDKNIKLECFLCRVIAGELELLEHKDSKWLSKEEIHSLDWADADREILDDIKKYM